MKNNNPIKGYKVVLPNLTWVEYDKKWNRQINTYEIGVICELDNRGISFHTNPKACFHCSVFNTKNRVVEVEILGEISGTDFSGFETNKLRVVRELSWEEVAEMANWKYSLGMTVDEFSRLPRETVIDGHLEVLSNSKEQMLCAKRRKGSIKTLEEFGIFLNEEASVCESLEVSGDFYADLGGSHSFSPSLDNNAVEWIPFPKNLVVGRDMELNWIMIDQDSPYNITIKGELDITCCMFYTPPDNMTVGKDINVLGLKFGSTENRMKGELKVGGDFLIENPWGEAVSGTIIEGFPNNLTVNGDLNLSDTTTTEYGSEYPVILPSKNAKIGGDILYDNNCQQLILPDTLSVNGNFYTINGEVYEKFAGAKTVKGKVIHRQISIW